MKAKFMYHGKERSFEVSLIERDGFDSAPPLMAEHVDLFSHQIIRLRLQAVDDGFAYYQIV